MRCLFGIRPGHSAPLHQGIGVATGVAKMVASDLLMYYHVRSLEIINNMATCIVQMQRSGVHPPFLKKNISCITMHLSRKKLIHND